jgi:uncharacterized protein YifN (PemK superfamily)
MAIKYYPKTGEVMICDFGPDYVRTATGGVDRAKAISSSGRLPPEMVKSRLVVVLNGKMEEGCMVVPLSSTEPSEKTAKGLYALVDSTLIPGHSFFTVKDRWAGGEQVQQVSKMRLQPFHPNRDCRPILPDDAMEAIQWAVIKAIRAGKLLTSAAVTAQNAMSVAPEVTHIEASALKVPTPVPPSAMAAALAVAMEKNAASSMPHVAAPSGTQLDQKKPDEASKAI